VSQYEVGVYIAEDGILHSHCRENLRSYTVIFLDISERVRSLLPQFQDSLTRYLIKS
jgi:hypothetical protein